MRRIAIILMIVLGVGIVAATGSSSKSNSPGTPGAGESHPAKADVTITKCAVASNQFEGPTATLQVLNHSSKASNYIITVSFDWPDGKTQLDTGNATVQNL